MSICRYTADRLITSRFRASRRGFHQGLLRSIVPQISGDRKELDSLPRYSAQQCASLPKLPLNCAINTRDFIHNSLYHPGYGYFSKHAHILSSATAFNFREVKDSLHLMNLMSEKYTQAETNKEESDSESGASGQIWHTPSELFKPWYGRAIAHYLITEYKLHWYPSRDLNIYELGAGNGTLMLSILDYIREYDMDVYRRTQYNIIEISPKLVSAQKEKQRQRNSVDGGHERVRIFNKSIFDWDQTDNFSHDLVRYGRLKGEPYQGVVCVDADGKFEQTFEPACNQELLELLSIWEKVGYKSRAAHPLLSRRLADSIKAYFLLDPEDHDLVGVSEYVPTQAFKFLGVLRDYFPHHRLLLSDFSALPDTIAGINAPVVQTRYQGQMIPVSTYMVAPGYFDIFFPTDFNLLADMYQAVCHSGITGEKIKVMKHAEFLSCWAELEETTTKSRENVMLDFYENAKFLLT